MTGKSLLTLLLVTMWVCLASGDIVYTRDGSKHEGVVRQEGETVFIETAGGVVEVPADNVVYISVVASDIDLPDEPANGGDAPPPSDGADGAGDQPAETLPAPPASVDDFTGGATPPAQTFSMDEATRPGSIVFMLMRQAANAATPRRAREISRQVEQWQAVAHDRKRRFGGQWLRPGDFTRSRQRYEELLADAEETAGELRRVKDGDPDAEETRADLRSVLNDKLVRAAAVWIDDDVRMFLTGVAHYQTGSYSLAVKAFERCRDSQPIVAAYQQGCGLALMEIPGRELDALAACFNELRLDPDNSLALLRITKAMENVPGGAETRDDLFVQADEMASQYPGSALPTNAPKTMVWHMPGKKGWSSSAGILPVPAYDRLIYRQGVAVPVGSYTLLVDKLVVQGALEVYVLLDDGTIVPATVVSKESDSDAPLALVRTREAQFQAVAASEDAQFNTDSAVAAYGLSIFPEMGTAPRQIVGKIVAVPDEGLIELDIALAPGESASPVLTGDKRLVGFLAGRTNFRRDNGGEDLLIPIADISPLIDQARRSSRYSSSRSKRRFEPIATEASTFVVYCISSETLD